MLASFTFAPIGFARTPFEEKREAPRQPAAARDVPGTIELLPGKGYEDALSDLSEWTHLWVVYVFDRAEGWRPKVLPPRSAEGAANGSRKGVFATRSPHRPNAIGLSVVRLERVEGLVVHVADVDLLDGTPVLDLKPYVKYTDVVTTAGDGWLAPADPRAAWAVAFTAAARAAFEFLRARGVDLEAAVTAALALGPQPHAYRRIRRDGDASVLALKEWRIRFRVDATQPHAITVLAIKSGYRPRDLATRADLQLHRELGESFP
ncbi:tRNA (N6-threonylcarbamoyladenosine(37)-N6)-methyltransferase TrmO [soil metagenome]